ncbi:CPBP family intramembrane glutamic endopeptidase [Cumulibacter manganitolerans]|uniref:CPBP family intramembrane glutamic endopeptidase n=1 Tax=Cumulibacter manganitolerans TaxID=1884992 RepID=UPI001E440D34|nr:CPBP family intramembrane glutamic endopeptidase [Cumulibacter manganitolerans]
MTDSTLPTAAIGRGVVAPRISRLAAWRSRPPWSGAVPRTVAVLVALLGLNLAAHTTGLPAAVVIPVGAAVLAVLAWASGLRIRSLGLHHHHLRHGLKVGLLSAAAVAAVLAVALLIPQTAQFFHDTRYASLSEVATAVLVMIPLTTVLPEELAFRGVLDGALQQHLGRTGSYAVGALAFGAWHVLTTGALTRGNSGLGGIVGSGLTGQLLSIGGVVAATSAAGVALIWLRRHTGSLLAPIGLHWAINGLAAIATRIATHPPF